MLRSIVFLPLFLFGVCVLVLFLAICDYVCTLNVLAGLLNAIWPFGQTISVHCFYALTTVQCSSCLCSVHDHSLRFLFSAWESSTNNENEKKNGERREKEICFALHVHTLRAKKKMNLRAHFLAEHFSEEPKCGYCCYVSNHINTGGLQWMPASNDFTAFAYFFFAFFSH